MLQGGFQHYLERGVTSRATPPGHPRAVPQWVQRRPCRSRWSQQLLRANAAAPEAPSAPAAAKPDFGENAIQGLRGNMEDEIHSHWNAAEGYLFLGCYDGHGGTAAAQWLKEHLHNYVANKLKEADKAPADTASILGSVFQEADYALLERLQGDDELEQTGSTATVAIVWPDSVSVANVGDSQACIMQRSRSVVQLTTPHRVYGPKIQSVEDEIARVKATGGWIYDGRVCNILAVSRAFGDWEFKGQGLSKLLSAGIQRGFWPAEFAEKQRFTSDPVIVTPATASAELTEEDEFLVVSTDGLWDVMPPKEALLYARKELLRGKRPREVAQSLTEVALRRYSTDNIGTLVVDFKDPEYWAEQNQQKPKGFWSFLFP